MKKLNKNSLDGFINYGIVIVAFAVIQTAVGMGKMSNILQSLLVPACCYIVMAVSLNLTVGILGELSLGHAGFMSLGAFAGITASVLLQSAIPVGPLRLAVSMLVGAAFGALGGVIVGVPVLRLQGDYLAIVTLAFGEIIKELINCLLVGCDENGLHIAFNISGTLTIDDLGMTPGGTAIIKGAQGATGTEKLASFGAGFILVMLTLVIVLNLVRSRAGRAVMAIRDNRIAAESIGVNVTKYKMIAFITSAALAGAAGALYGLNYSSLAASKFDFNTSILVLVYVVLGGLGNIWGSVIAAAVLGGPAAVLRLPDAGVRHRAHPGDAGHQQPHHQNLPGLEIQRKGGRLTCSRNSFPSPPAA